MNDEQNTWIQYHFDQETTAMTFRTSMGPEVPSFYRRTYILGMALAPLIAGVAGLFDRDADVWVWSKGKGFRPVVLRKRVKP